MLLVIHFLVHELSEAADIFQLLWRHRLIGVECAIDRHVAVIHSDGVTANPLARCAKHYLCVLLTLARWPCVTPSRRHELGKVADGPHAVAHIHA